MKKELILLTLLTLCWTTIEAQNLKFGKPTDEEMQMTVYEQDPEAEAVVLCQLTNVNYTMDMMDFLVDYEVKTRIKILKEEGKEYANITIPYIFNSNEDFMQETFENFKATAYNLENGKVKKTKIGLEKIYNERIDEDNMVAKIAIPQVKAGTVIEYEYKLHSNVYYHIHDWYASAEIPVAYANYRLEIPIVFIYNVEYSGLQQLQNTVTAGALLYKASSDGMANQKKCQTNIYNCTGRNLKGLKKDDYVWNVRDYFTKITAELQRINFAGESRDMRKTWEQVDEVLFEHPDFGHHLYKHSKYRDELAASGISEINDLKEKVTATFKFLRQRLAWDGEYELAIKSASEIVKKGNGSNADLNMMLINMLGDVGVKAYPVVMSTRRHGRLPQTYPTLNKLNTFIVGVPYGSTWLYIDASSTYGYLNVLPPNLYTDKARIIQKGKPGQWVDLQKIGEAKTIMTVKAELSPSGEMKGELQALHTGNAAEKIRKLFVKAADSTAYIADRASYYGIKIDQCNMEGHRDFVPNLTETVSFTRQGETTGDLIYINPFIEVPIRENPFTEKERLLPVEIPYKQTFNTTVQLTLPEGWKLEEMPQNIRVTSEDKSISGHILYESTDERIVSITYQFRLSKVTYDNNQYQMLRQLFELFANRSKDMLVIKKK
ncbi:MAG: DUF3857 domain-containing protein [Prevotella sp.]|nr:DUF3857 domain-containing protein [Prevotella sp.]MBR3078844.1 DUF3857 domain-containing protein [Prevotella sp.]